MIERAIRFIALIAGCPRCGSKSLKIEQMLYIPNLMTTKITISCSQCSNRYRLAVRDEVLWKALTNDYTL